MSRARIQFIGDKEVLDKLAASGKSAEGSLVQVGSPLNYAFGIETGRHQGGRLARRAGGAFYLRNAAASVQQALKHDIAQALPKGPETTLDALKKVGMDVERKAKAAVPVVTGTLRRSIQTIYPGRGVVGGGIAVGMRMRGRATRRPR